MVFHSLSVAVRVHSNAFICYRILVSLIPDLKLFVGTEADWLKVVQNPAA